MASSKDCFTSSMVSCRYWIPLVQSIRTLLFLNATTPLASTSLIPSPISCWARALGSLILESTSISFLLMASLTDSSRGLTMK